MDADAEAALVHVVRQELYTVREPVYSRLNTVLSLVSWPVLSCYWSPARVGDHPPGVGVPVGQLPPVVYRHDRVAVLVQPQLQQRVNLTLHITRHDMT